MEEKNVDGEDATDASGCLLRMHKGKRSAMWKVYDLSCTHPKCKLIQEGTKDVVCGESPSGSAGTTHH